MQVDTVCREWIGSRNLVMSGAGTWEENNDLLKTHCVSCTMNLSHNTFRRYVITSRNNLSYKIPKLFWQPWGKMNLSCPSPACSITVTTTLPLPWFLQQVILLFCDKKVIFRIILVCCILARHFVFLYLEDKYCSQNIP
jgi:hypothetical protein